MPAVILGLDVHPDYLFGIEIPIVASSEWQYDSSRVWWSRPRKTRTSRRRLPLDTIWPSVLGNVLPPDNLAHSWHTGTSIEAATVPRLSPVSLTGLHFT